MGARPPQRAVLRSKLATSLTLHTSQVSVLLLVKVGKRKRETERVKVIEVKTSEKVKAGNFLEVLVLLIMMKSWKVKVLKM